MKMFKVNVFKLVFFKITAFLLTQAVVVLNCAFAFQNPSVNNNHRNSNNLLSPHATINSGDFLSSFGAVEQKVRKGEEAEPSPARAVIAKDFRGEGVLFGGNTREFKLLLAALLHRAGSQNTVRQIL